MESKATRSANKLSGGEQQRVAIARAMVNSPSLILADEPTGNLDSENSHKVFDLLQELAERDNLGVLIVTHNTDLALKTDNLIRMQDGLIVKD
jgi:lipoprotein-releasing system ATP-binding protein